MRAVKILVTAMGVVIVVGFGVVAAVIAGRLSRREPANTAHAFAASSIDLPRGARIEAMTATADRLVLDLALPDGGRRIIIVDLATGSRLGTIDLHAVP
jgi:flagellar basal body-associated protein FliL